MKLTEQETAALYRDATARREGGPECLDDEILLRASTNDLNAVERERIAAHIAQCSDCAREYRVARAMRPFAADARLALGRRRVPQWWAAAAAAVAAVVIATYAWQTTATLRDVRRNLVFEQGELAHARREMARARSQVHPFLPPVPQLAVPIVDVDPEPIRGAATAVASVDVPAGTNELALVLHLPANVQAPAALAVIDAKGAVVWRGTATSGVDEGTLTIALPRNLIPTGSYVVRVAKTAFPFRVTWR